MTKIESIRVRPVIVPFVTRTAAGDVTQAPLALVDLTTSDGVVGCSYIFTYTNVALKPVCDLIEAFAKLVIGKPVAPLAAESALVSRMRLLGDTGLITLAISAIDMACWDALAKSVKLPLARLLGGDITPIKCYLSVGMDGAAGAEKAAETAVAKGFGALKIKIGFPNFADDLEAVERARWVLGDKAGLMIDYNQSLDVPEALRRCGKLDDMGLMWIEEPTLQDNYSGNAKIAAALRTPIQIGENWYGTREMAKSMAAGASDLAMLDLMKIGGVTGWLRPARLAEDAGLPVSSHLFPEMSTHLMCVTPTAHWIEYINLADPILAEPMQVSKGMIHLSESPGSGVQWDEDAVARYAA
jgi:mandelate racemase